MIDMLRINPTSLYFKYFIICIILLSGCIHARVNEYSEKRTLCEAHQSKDGLKIGIAEDDTDVRTTETCETPSSCCFVVWQNDSRRIDVMKKGCFEHANCAGHKTCVSNEKKKNLLFCCCEGDLCNREFSYEPNFALPSTAVDDELIEDENSYLLLILVCCCIAIISFFAYYKLHCLKQNVVELAERVTLPSGSPVIETYQPIELIECKAEGKFGVVWKAKMKNNVVAVKIVPAQEKQSWLTEKEIFQLPFIDHDNILNFLAAEKRGDNLVPEYWLITAYHELGSLNDYLKTNTVTLEQLCIISFTMARGLAHLHEDIRSIRPEFHKPPIAHRDFKSSNILLKNDLSACIADFGLALIFKTQTCVTTQPQVGTRRYMAPEVLEGVINFSSSSFLRIDMYACGLILWEILSRCIAHEDIEKKYKQPFEAELGEHPSMDAMLNFIVYKKGRPVLDDAWRKHSLLSHVCTIIEECWDADAEARLSAACVTERFSGYLQSIVKNEAKLLYNIV